MAKKKAAKKEEAAESGQQIARSAEEVDKEWLAKVEELKQRKLTLAHDTLQFYYDVGALATELMNSAANNPEYRKYGAHTAEELQSQLTLGKSTFYAAMQFVACVDGKTLTRMKTMQMPWSAVQQWLTVDKANKRTKLLDDFESRKIKNRKDFRKAVQKTKPSVDAPTPDGVTLAFSQAKSFNTFAEQAESKALPGLVDSLKAYKKNNGKMSEAMAAKFTEEIKEAKKHLATLNRLVDSAEKALASVGV